MTTTQPANISPAARPPAQLQFPDTLQLTRWVDPRIEAVGFPPHHVYVELLWLPIIGPSTTWIYRRLGELLVRRPGNAAITLTDLACAVGLGSAIGPSSTLQQSLRRLIRFGLARWNGLLAVRTMAPPISQRHLERLPAPLQAMHDSLLAARTHSSGATQ